MISVRKEKIVEILQTSGDMSISELSELVHVSLNTVRADIKDLEAEGLLKKTHGRVAIIQEVPKSPIPSIDIRHQYYRTEKKQIGHLAYMTLPKKPLSVFIDDSSTVIEFIKFLRDWPYPLTIITNYIEVPQYVAGNKNISIILNGGTLWTSEHCTYGSRAVADVMDYHADIAIIGCSGLHPEKGLFNGKIETVEIRQAMQKQAKETWILVDHSKFDRISLVHIFSFDQVNKVFSDRNPGSIWQEFFSQHNIECIYPKQ
ncbi:MAG: DeoR/GlpR family DNA-binding transcription regulator [Brevinema sp.]